MILESPDSAYITPLSLSTTSCLTAFILQEGGRRRGTNEGRRPHPEPVTGERRQRRKGQEPPAGGGGE